MPAATDPTTAPVEIATLFLRAGERVDGAPAAEPGVGVGRRAVLLKAETSLPFSGRSASLLGQGDLVPEVICALDDFRQAMVWPTPPPPRRAGPAATLDPWGRP